MKKALPFLVLTLLLVLAAVLNVAFGSVQIPLADQTAVLAAWLRGEAVPVALETVGLILVALRIPHMALMALTGAALGGSGATFQGVFRNPLADPFLIGVAAGSGLGAVAAMQIHWPYTAWGLLAVPAAAFLGGMLTVLVVYAIARVGRTVPTTNLLLAGAAINAFATAVTSFLMITSDSELRRAIGWMLGGASFTGWQPVLTILPYLLSGLVVLLFSGHALNLLQFGDEQAQQLGLNVVRTRAVLLLAASLITAAAVAFSGLIGFIGLMVPHAVRMWTGSDHRRLIPLSLLGGAAALLAADLLARWLLSPQELPVGILTSLIGGPFFLWVLRRSRNQGAW